MKKILYFSIISSLIGANVISINLGGFQLSLFRMSILIMLCILILELLVGSRKIPISIKRPNKYSINFMIFWLVYAIFSLAWVKDYNAWTKSVFFLSLGLICIILFNTYFKNKSEIITSFKVITLFSIFHNLLGWFEVITGTYIFVTLEKAFYFARGNYPVSVFGNPNDFATFMLFVVFISFTSIKNSSSIIMKNIYRINMASSIVLLFLSGSRANILGLILGLIIFIFISLKYHKTRRTVGGLLVIGFIIIALFPDSINLMRNELDFSSAEIVGSDNVRINLIKNGIAFLLNTFLLGTGSGNSEYWMQYHSIYWTGGIYNLHNWWVEILVNYGLIIFLMYIIFYINLFRSMMRKFKVSSMLSDKSLSLTIIACMSGYLLGSISSSSNLNSEWLWVFWGLVISYQGMISKGNLE